MELMLNNLYQNEGITTINVGDRVEIAVMDFAIIHGTVTGLTPKGNLHLKDIEFMSGCYSCADYSSIMSAVEFDTELDLIVEIKILKGGENNGSKN